MTGVYNVNPKHESWIQKINTSILPLWLNDAYGKMDVCCNVLQYVAVFHNFHPKPESWIVNSEHETTIRYD